MSVFQDEGPPPKKKCLDDNEGTSATAPSLDKLRQELNKKIENKITDKKIKFSSTKIKASKEKGNIYEGNSIKKHISWDGKRYRGYVDLGNGIDDSFPAAKDAFVYSQH